MRKTVLLIFILILNGGLHAQKDSEFANVDKIMLQIPASQTESTDGIAAYINSKFTKQSDKSRAVFSWITRNISYDIQNMYAVNFYQDKKEIIDRAIKTHLGICMSYAELFNEIANKVGIKSYLIAGYTKQNNKVDYIPHAWNAALIDSKWCVFDPTWGAGYIQNGKFVWHVNNSYYMTKPEELIASHMPFDPLWQFMNYTVTNAEFYAGKTQVNNKKPYFNFVDSILNYENQSEVEQLISSSNRIEKNGIKNSIVYDRLQYSRREIEYLHSKKAVEQYNAGLNSFNSGINLLNEFIAYRNKQFTPLMPDAEIQQMVDTIDVEILSARKQIKKIENPSKEVAGSMIQLYKSMDDATRNLNEQKVFLEKYFKTAKIFRKTLFVKYTWMGITIN